MRLGDLDALKETIKNSFKHNFQGYDALLISEIDEFIDNAPTVEPKLSDEQIEKITELLENEWGYEGIREDVSRILRGEEE